LLSNGIPSGYTKKPVCNAEYINGITDRPYSSASSLLKSDFIKYSSLNPASIAILPLKLSVLGQPTGKQEEMEK